MRTAIVCSLLSSLVLSVTATAQYPYGGNPNYGGLAPYGGYGGYGGYGAPQGGPYGNPAFGGSPVSPYLNLTGRGGANGIGNAAVNYYNFVRPNLPNVARPGAFAPMATGWGAKPSYFPALQSLDEEGFPTQQRTGVKDKAGNEHVRMPPTGHAASYDNTLGYYGPAMGGYTGTATQGRIR